MIHIVLVILKIIGILLAFLLGLVLLLVLLFLFCPVRYRFCGKMQKEFVIYMNFTFMKPLIIVCFDYDKDMKFKIKILGISVWRDRQRETKKSHDDLKIKDKDKNKDKGQNEEKSLNNEINVTDNTTKEENNIVSMEIDNNRIKDIDTNSLNQKKRTSQKKVSFVKSHFQSLKDKIKGLKAFFVKLIHSFTSFQEFILKIKELLQDNRFYAGYQVIKDEVLFLLEKSKPKKYQWYIHYGTGDPCTTGQLLGFLGVLHALWGKGLIVEPDFEQTVLQSEFDCRGKIHGIYALRFIIKLYKDKDINYLKKQILKIRRS